MPFRAGGRTFTGTDVSTTASTAGISDLGLAKTLSFLWIGKQPASVAGSHFFCQKSSNSATRGWGFFISQVTQPGQLRFFAGVSAGNQWAIYNDATVPANLCVDGAHEACGFAMNASGVTFFKSAADQPIAQCTGTNGQVLTPLGTPATDSGDALWIGSQGGAQPHGGDTSWGIVFNVSATLDQMRKAQQAALMYQAGDTTRAIAAMFAVGSGVCYARFIANDGSVTDWTANNAGTTFAAGSGQLTGTTAGASLENSAAGTQLNQLFSLTTAEDDNEPSFNAGAAQEQTHYRYTSSAAQRRFTTAATQVTLWCWQALISGVGTLFGNDEVISVWDEGAGYVGQLTAVGTSEGLTGGTVSGMSASAKTVAIVNGPRSRRSASAVHSAPEKGTFATVAYFNASATALSPNSRSRLIRLISDSILDGFTGNPFASSSAMQRIRRALPSGFDGVEQSGFGGMYLSAITASGPVQTTYVTAAVAGNPRCIIIQLGANDKGGATLSAAAFQTALAGFVDQILAVGSFTGRILLVSPTITSASEGANGLGSTMDDYRNAIAAVQSTRTARVSHLAGKTAASVGNLSDGVHFNNTGQLELETALRSSLAVIAASLASSSNRGRRRRRLIGSVLL